MSIEDLIERTERRRDQQKSLESLIYSGALDAYGERNSLLESMTKMTAYLKEIESKRDFADMII